MSVSQYIAIIANEINSERFSARARAFYTARVINGLLHSYKTQRERDLHVYIYIYTRRIYSQSTGRERERERTLLLGCA